MLVQRVFSCLCFLSAIAVTMAISIKYMDLEYRAAVLNDVDTNSASYIISYDACGGIFIDPLESTNWT